MRRLAFLLAFVAACSSDSTSTPAPVAQVCTPGQQVECPCPGGEQGAQACQDDGAGYDACDCPTGGAGGTGGASGSAGTGGTAGTGGSAGVGGTAGAGGTTGSCTSSCVASAEGYAACGARVDSCGAAEDCGGCEPGAWSPTCVELEQGGPTFCVPTCMTDNQAFGSDITGCFDVDHPALYTCQTEALATFWAARWAPDCLGPSLCSSLGVSMDYALACAADHTPLRRKRLVERPPQSSDQSGLS